MCVCLNLQVVKGGQKSGPPDRGSLNHQTLKIDKIHCFKSLGFGGLNQVLYVRPHHRLQQQQHRSLFYILPCLLLAIVVNIPKFFETETVTMRDKFLALFEVVDRVNKLASFLDAIAKTLTDSLTD